MRNHGTVKEIHVGIVEDNNDPEQRGRIRVRCDTLVGFQTTFPDYIDPVFPYLAGNGEKATGGWFFIPDPGTKVELEITSTHPHDETFGGISVDAPQIRWRACVFAASVDDINEEFRGDNYPNRKGIVTRDGHGLIFDDTPGDPEVKLFQANDAGTSFLAFDENGSATLLTSAGHLLFMDQENGALSLVDTNQNALVMNEDGWYITDDDGNMISANDSSFLFAAKTTLLFNATQANFNVGGVLIAQVPALASPVIIEGPATPFTTALAASLTEFAALLTLMGLPTTNTMALITALSAGVHTSDLTETE